jgi:hypothetical protein
LSRIWLSKVRLLYRPKQYAANPPLRRIHCIPPTATSPIGSSINVWIEAQKTGNGPSFFARMTKAPPKSKKHSLPVGQQHAADIPAVEADVPGETRPSAKRVSRLIIMLVTRAGPNNTVL